MTNPVHPGLFGAPSTTYGPANMFMSIFDGSSHNKRSISDSPTECSMTPSMMRCTPIISLKCEKTSRYKHNVPARAVRAQRVVQSFNAPTTAHTSNSISLAKLDLINQTPRVRENLFDFEGLPWVPCRFFILYPFFRIHFRFSSDFSLGVKPYNSNDFSIRRSVELFSFSELRVLTGVATQGILLNKRARHSNANLCEEKSIG